MWMQTGIHGWILLVKWIEIFEQFESFVYLHLGIVYHYAWCQKEVKSNGQKIYNTHVFYVYKILDKTIFKQSP